MKNATHRAAGAPEAVMPAGQLPAESPEYLVGFGFRCWLTGYETGDLGHWELAWRRFSTVLGAGNAKPALAGLSHWVRSVRVSAQRPIAVGPATAAGFCRDECMAISLIAACQSGACPAARACAFALLGTSFVDTTMDTAGSFAMTMTACGQRLSAGSVCQVTCALAVRPVIVN